MLLRDAFVLLHKGDPILRQLVRSSRILFNLFAVAQIVGALWSQQHTVILCSLAALLRFGPHLLVQTGKIRVLLIRQLSEPRSVQHCVSTRSQSVTHGHCPAVT